MQLILGSLSNFEGVDLTTVDTSYPVLASGQLLPFKIVEVKIDPTKDKTGQMLITVLQLQSVANDKNGNELQPGLKITNRIMLTPTEKRTNEMILRDVSVLLDACYGVATRKTIKLDTFDALALVGTDVMAKTHINPEKDGFAESTGIRLVAKKDEAVAA